MRKQQADAVGTPEVEIFADHGLEEVAALDRTGEDLREADLHLLQRKAVRVAGRVIARG